MQEIRFVHVVEAWGYDQAAADYITGVLREIGTAASQPSGATGKRNILYQGPIHASIGLHRISTALSNVYADCPIELSIHTKSLDKDYLVQCKKAAAA
jgi:hypothetical protein